MGAEFHSSSDAQMKWEFQGLVKLLDQSHWHLPAGQNTDPAVPEGVGADTALATLRVVPPAGAQAFTLTPVSISGLAGDILCLPVPPPGRAASQKAKCVSKCESECLQVMSLSLEIWDQAHQISVQTKYDRI